MKLFRFIVQVACLAIATNAYADDVLSYILAPGSTITPYFGATPIGPTEPLTGSFDWVRFDTGSSLIGFDATRLELQSTSFLIELNADMNDLGSVVFPDSCLTFFGEIVDLEGLGMPVGELSSFGTNSCYSGPPDRPTLLSYPDLRIAPIGGGFFVARLTIIAVLDSDRDSVPDNTDQCPNTAPGAVIDARGCSISQLVPCAGPFAGGAWKNHGQYVSAIARTAEAFLAGGLITEEEKEAIVEAAAQSNCGQRR
jgi:hypothetical protein